jgi:hypothetical protein
LTVDANYNQLFPTVIVAWGPHAQASRRVSLAVEPTAFLYGGSSLNHHLQWRLGPAAVANGSSGLVLKNL